MRHVLLNFHGIGAPARPLEDGEAPYWVTADFYHAVLDMAQHYAAQTQTDFTFDDGNSSDLLIGAEGLARHGRTGQFFVLTDRIDTPGSLGRADIAALIKAGHQIGNHGAAHVSWREADAATLQHEVGQARADLAQITGQPVTAAAIPFGQYNKTVLTALRREGYTHAYSSDGGAYRPGQWPCPRTSPRGDMALEDIDILLSGREPLKRRIRRRLVGALKKRI